MTNEILYETNNRKAYITINRPDEMNCLTLNGWKLLGESFEKANKDLEVDVIIFSGKGNRAFCAGADLKSTIPALFEDYNHDPIDHAVLKYKPTWKPIIAAVNGHCLAGGMELLQATDIRIAVEHAKFGLPEVKWGLIAAGGSLARLVRQIPYSRAMEIFLTGEPITAEEALKIGLINKVVSEDELLETVEQYADKILKNSSVAVQRTKEAVIRLRSLPMEQAFHQEWVYAEKAFTHEDSREGIRAFAEKREPKYK